MTDLIISISNLSKNYQVGEITVPALKNLSLNIEKGKFLFIIGPSGSGKTTLLNLIGGIDRADEGTIVVNSKEITKMEEKILTEYRRADVGFVFQFYNLIPTLKAIENVETTARLKFKNANERSLKMLEEVGLQDKSFKFPAQLSGGEQQRVAIARALVKEPKIVLADEPTGNIDSETGTKILELMRDICQKKQTTFLVVTHNTVLAEKFADEIINLQDGKVFRTTKPVSA
ncbi:MAG: ABC transporter ATP-binding protein [Candidatus Hermodarchaeota archaeon]